jgi:tetratricopeptide (TPR) repeat protein
MGTTWGGSRRIAAWAALLVLAALPGALSLARAENQDDKSAEASLRKNALELNEITGSAPMRGKLQKLIDDADGTKKLLTVAAKMVKEKPKDPPFNRNATLLLALAAENFKQVEISATFYRLNALQSMRLLSERSMAQAYLGLIQMYSDNKRFTESEKVCREFLNTAGEEDEVIERLRPLVKRRLVLAVARQGAYDKALKLVDELIKEDSREWLNRALKAQVLRAAEKLEESAKVYLEVIERAAKDEQVPKKDRDDAIEEYRYALSGIYADLNQIDKASEQLKALLQRDPTNPTYNNDLGYIWADRGLHLEEAEKLIRKAIDEDRKQRRSANPPLRPEEDHDSAAYLDSLGWVLFKQGKSKEAKTYLLQATKDREGQSIEIYDHLAEVYLALGKKTEALAAWKKGLESITSSRRDQKRKAEVEKKVKALTEKKVTERETDE